MFPAAKGISAEPAQQSSAADLSDRALGNNVLADFLNREPRQCEPEGVRKLAGECLNPNDETGGKAGFTPPSRLLLKARQSGRDTIPLMQSLSDYVTVHLQQANRRSADIRSHAPTAGRQRTDEEAQPAKRRLLRADSSEAGRIGIAVHSAPG